MSQPQRTRSIKLLSGLFAGLSVLAMLAMLAACVYAEAPAFAPRGDWITLDFRGIYVVVTLCAQVMFAGVGALGAGLGLAFALRSDRTLVVWWTALSALFGAELLLALTVALLHPAMESVREELFRGT